MDKYELHEAARNGDLATARTLLEANPKLALLKDLDSRTPLHWACSLQHPAVVELLLAPKPGLEIDIDEQVDESGWTPFHIACSVGNLEIIQMLWSHDPQPDVNLQTSNGQTGLHYAVSKGHADVVDFLLKECKASARIKDRRAQLPLHRAASNGAYSICEQLVKQGKSPVNAADSDGFTALHHALSEGHGDVALLLVKLGADFEVKDREGLTPVQVAVDDKVKRFFQKGLAEEGLI